MDTSYDSSDELEEELRGALQDEFPCNNSTVNRLQNHISQSHLNMDSIGSNGTARLGVQPFLFQEDLRHHDPAGSYAMDSDMETLNEIRRELYAEGQEWSLFQNVCSESTDALAEMNAALGGLQEWKSNREAASNNQQFAIPDDLMEDLPAMLQYDEDARARELLIQWEMQQQTSTEARERLHSILTTKPDEGRCFSPISASWSTAPVSPYVPQENLPMPPPFFSPIRTQATLPYHTQRGVTDDEMNQWEEAIRLKVDALQLEGSLTSYNNDLDRVLNSLERLDNPSRRTEAYAMDNDDL